jgi:acetyl esterase/lipase
MKRTTTSRMMRQTAFFSAAVLFFTAPGTAIQRPASAPQEIRLWPGKAPGTETWTVAETATTSPAGDRTTIANVSDPSVTVFLPSPAVATGAAVVVAPGGALRALAWDSEGVKVAQWLNSKGIAALVLKYRTLQNSGGAARGRGAPPQAIGNRGAARGELEIRNANANPEPGDPALAEVLRMGTADAQQALRLARRNAAEWRIDPTRVGIMGFSAGGGIAVGTALAERSEASPDFLVSVYGPALQDVIVPADAPPLFIAVGSTHFNVTNGCLALFGAWKAAGKPAEIHVYDQVSGGFGMSTRGLPVDTWNERLYEWLLARKIVVKK